MLPSQTALLSDLDGTLFARDGKISPENAEAIRRYMDQGGLFAIATGREPRNAAIYLTDVPMNAPSIVLNGAGLFDYSDDTYTIFKKLDTEKVRPFFREMLRRFPEADMQVYTEEEGIVYTTPEENASPGLLNIHANAVFIPYEELKSDFIKTMTRVPERTDELLRYLEEGERAGLFRIVPGTAYFDGVQQRYFETMPLDVSKGSALQVIRTLPAYKGRTIITFGDYWNDEELLRQADIPVCPSNAEPELKALCPWVGPSNDEHLLKRFIEDRLPLI